MKQSNAQSHSKTYRQFPRQKLTISPQVFRKFNPLLKIMFVLAQGIDAKAHRKESTHLLQEVVALTKLTFNKDTWKTHDFISPWQAARADFGKNAVHYKTPLEQLLHAVLHHKNISASDTVTNIIRYITLQHLVPIGVDDLEKIKGDVHFAVATGFERHGVLHHIKKGELYYRDERGILGLKLDAWKSKRTRLSTQSKKVLIHVDILPPITAAKMQEIRREVVKLLQTFCNAKVQVLVLDKKKQSALI